MKDSVFSEFETPDACLRHVASGFFYFSLSPTGLSLYSSLLPVTTFVFSIERTLPFMFPPSAEEHLWVSSLLQAFFPLFPGLR